MPFKIEGHGWELQVKRLGLPLFSLPDWEIKITRDALGLEMARRMPGGVVAMWKRDAFARPVEREVISGAFPEKRAREVSKTG